MKRASLSKRTRFKIFERDRFTCQYCGNQPPAVVLQLDHIHPFSEGGSDTEENLITACHGCNAGKSNRVLGAIQPRPDADAQFLEMQQEIAEARLYLESKQERDRVYELMVDSFLDAYEKFVGRGWRPKRTVIHDWLLTYGPDEVDYAIRATGRRGRLIDGGDAPVSYIGGILRAREKENKSEN